MTKYFKSLASTILLVIATHFANPSIADISIHLRDANDLISISQFLSQDNQTLLVAATLNSTQQPGEPSTLLDFIAFETGAILSALPIDSTPLFAPPGTQRGILALPQLGPNLKWTLFKPDQSLGQLVAEASLQNYAVVTETLQTDRGLYVLGMNVDRQPIVSVLNPDYVQFGERAKSHLSPGAVTGALSVGDDILALVTAENGSVIVRMSSDLNTVSETTVDGFGANGTTLPHGGYAITYVKVPDMTVILELFDNDHTRSWRRTLYVMSSDAISSGSKIKSAPNGVAFAGFNNGNLLIGKVSMDGKKIETREISHNKIDFDPRSTSYFLYANESETHVHGIGYDTDTHRKMLYHAIDR